MTPTSPARGPTAARAAVVDTGTPSDGAGPPVVLLHGWTGSKEDFDAIVPALAADRRVVVPDLPGHGGTPPSAGGDYSLPAHVRFLDALLADLGVADFHLLGHSHGGLIAQRLAHAMAHRIRSMVLVGSGLGALGETSREAVLRVATAARDHGMAAAWRELHDGADGAAGEVAESPREAFVRRRFLAMPPAAVIGVARNLVVTAPLGAFLRGVDFPVLVCHGEGDETWLPHEQRLLARSIAGASYRVIPDALHSPAQEHPDALLAEVRPFLARADPPEDVLDGGDPDAAGVDPHPTTPTDA